MTEPAKIVTIEPPASVPARMTPMGLLAQAVEKGADVAQLERLMDLQTRWEANEARKAYVEAKAAFYRDAPEITKNKHVKHNNFWHATLDHIVEVAAPVLARHGLTHSWQTTQTEAGIEVACILRHVMGHEERVSLRAGADTSGSKNAVQSIGSTVTYLERYTFMAVTGLAAKNQDDDGGRGGVDFVTEEQAMELETLAESVGADKAKFLKFMKADGFGSIPAKRYKEATEALKKKAKPA